MKRPERYSLDGLRMTPGGRIERVNIGEVVMKYLKDNAQALAEIRRRYPPMDAPASDGMGTKVVDLASLKAERDRLAGLLETNGFRRCDIPACNCNSWHHVGGFAARFAEIKEATDDHYRNGETLLARVQRIVAELSAARAALEWYANALGNSKSMDYRIITQDGGQRARDSLMKL